MSIAATDALTAWINSRPIVGEGNALAQGAFLANVRSPADGAYAVVSRNSEGTTAGLVAEGAPFSVARLQAMVFAGTEQAAEIGAAALRSEFETLNGCAERCGTTGVKILVADNHIGPFLIPVQPDGGEIYCFQVGADFVLTDIGE